MKVLNDDPIDDDTELLDALVDNFASIECYPDTKRGVTWTVRFHPHRLATEPIVEEIRGTLRSAIRAAVRELEGVEE